MSNILIKICGVQQPELALQAAVAGANFIGIVFHPQSKRYVNPKHAKLVATAAKANGAQPVAVFTDQSAKTMLEICELTGITIIQLHGNTAKSQHHLLPAQFQRFYVQAILPDGSIIKDAENGLQYCDPQRDYLLFDNAQPGIGRAFDWKKFNYHGIFKRCLAGGLTSANVGAAIASIHPDIVDVSSGVENQSGTKDLVIIKDFISAVHTGEYNHDSR